MRRRILLVLLLFLLAVLAVTALFARPIADHPYYAQFQRWPLVIAHQGGGGLWPGNTLFAFQRAVEMGVDVLEMDLHITADGVLVLMHDETVDRTTDGSGSIEEMTLAELKTLDAGYDWSPDDGKTFPFRGQGITAATLEEMFTAFPGMPMNIEIKKTQRDMAEPFCALIRQFGKENEVLVASFHDERMQSFRQTCPEVATSGSEDELIPLVVLSKVELGLLYRPAAVTVQAPERRSGINILVPSFIRAARSRNMKVEAWTINDPADMQRLLALGVDGIITDYPDRLLAILQR